MKMKGKRLLALAIAGAMAALLAAGCSSNGSSSAAAPASSEAASSTASQELQPISLAYLNKAGYETVIAADAEGIFAEGAVPVELLPVSGSGQQAVEALLAGSADIAATGQGPVANAIGEYGEDIVVLCGTNCNTDSQVIVAGPALTGDTQIVAYDKAAGNEADVKASFESAAVALGHPVRVGVQQGATTESALRSWLKKMDVSVNEFGEEGEGTVSLVDVKANTLPTVLATGDDIDMMAASQPYPDTAVASVEGAYRVGSNADTDSYDVACYITTKAIYEQKEASIQAFIEDLKAATDYLSDEANEQAAIDACAESMGADRETVVAAFEVADWKTAMSDTMIKSIVKAAAKNYPDVTEETVRACCPLIDWLDELNE